MSQEPKDSVKPSNHTLGHALGAVAGTAVDQARDLAVAQLDCWAERLRQRLEVPVADAPAVAEPAAEPVAARPVVPGIAKPLIVGALAGAAVAWLLAGRRTEP